jgi:hypothetical protein
MNTDPSSKCATCPVEKGLCPCCVDCGKCGARPLPRKDGAHYTYPKDHNEHTVYLCAGCVAKRYPGVNWS